MESELLAGRYKLVAQVGEGATGRVWRGVDTLLQRAVAIKIVDLAGATDPAMAERFRREGIAIAGLSDDAIVKVWDTGTDARRGWLVMELLSGPNISRLVKEGGPLSYQVAMPLLADVAEGLQAAHDAGITHRDVKPANIVLDAPRGADDTPPDLLVHPELGRPVLVDFGIARLVDEAGKHLTRPATAIGTAAYMSPEQARGMEVGPASDVYSLGCVAYHLLLGRPPFLADSSIAVAHSQAFDIPIPLAELSPDAPPALDTLVTRMLAKDPGERPTAREVATELRAIAANPQIAPSVPLDPTATQLMGATAETQLIGDQPVAGAPLGHTQAMPPTQGSAAAATYPSAQYPASEQTGWQDPANQADYGPVADAAQPPDGDGKTRGTRHWGAWLVGLLIVGLIAALVYSWTTGTRTPAQIPTVTLTSTATSTPTTTSARPTTTAPTTTTAAVPTTTAPTMTTTTQQPTTTAPPTTATQVPTTTQQPPTTATSAPEPTSPDDTDTEDPGQSP